jgi:phage/plasmid-associated DNA primase
LEKVQKQLQAEIEILQVERKIKTRVAKQMERSQKEHYLNEQMQAIQRELEWARQNAKGGRSKGKARLARLEELQSVEYQRRNDYIADFIDTRLMKDAKGVLMVDEAYVDFRQWIRDDGISERTTLSKPDFSGYMEKQLGKFCTINKQKGWKGWKLASTHMDEEDEYD